jgi:protein TonB
VPPPEPLALPLPLPPPPEPLPLDGPLELLPAPLLPLLPPPLALPPRPPEDPPEPPAAASLPGEDASPSTSVENDAPAQWYAPRLSASRPTPTAGDGFITYF